MKRTPRQVRRDKRLARISDKVERYKQQPVTEERIIELMDDAIWILGELEFMTQQSIEQIEKQIKKNA